MSIPYFDAHCDTVSRGAHHGWELRKNIGHIDLERGRKFSRYAQVFALFHSAGDAPEGQLWPICQKLYAHLLEQLAKNSESISFCRTGEEVDTAIKSGKMAALLSIEGAELLECCIERIETAAQWGTRLMNLTWNFPNAISGTNLREQERGLSAYGRDFVRELENHGIYADVSHLSDTGFWDLVHMARKPIVASHSNARVLCPHSRNLTDDMFRAIRDSGGVVGMNFYRAFVGEGEDALIAHVEHFLEMDGEKTVCFGGDLDGCDVLAGTLQGLQDVSSIYNTLQRRGYSESLLEDLFWNNLRRLF